jgi:hypothetical protein
VVTTVFLAEPDANELCDLIQTHQNPAEATQPCLEVLDDLLGKLIWLRQVIEVSEALVFEPEDIEARLVARGQLLIGELALATFRVLVRIPSCFALVSVFRIIAIDEVGKVLKA